MIDSDSPDVVYHSIANVEVMYIAYGEARIQDENRDPLS